MQFEVAARMNGSAALRSPVVGLCEADHQTRWVESECTSAKPV